MFRRNKSVLSTSARGRSLRHSKLQLKGRRTSGGTGVLRMRRSVMTKMKMISMTSLLRLHGLLEPVLVIKETPINLKE
jgi:hypothetical protein